MVGQGDHIAVLDQQHDGEGVVVVVVVMVEEREGGIL
jgi:hypothetical protein